QVRPHVVNVPGGRIREIGPGEGRGAVIKSVLWPPPPSSAPVSPPFAKILKRSAPLPANRLPTPAKVAEGAFGGKTRPAAGPAVAPWRLQTSPTRVVLPGVWPAGSLFPVRRPPSQPPLRLNWSPPAPPCRLPTPPKKGTRRAPEAVSVCPTVRSETFESLRST